MGTCQHVSSSVTCQMATWTLGTFRSHWSSTSWDDGLGPSVATQPGLTLASVSYGLELVWLEQCLWEDSEATAWGCWVRTEAEGQIHLTQLLLPRYAPATSASHPASHILHPASPLPSSLGPTGYRGALLTSLIIPNCCSCGAWQQGDSHHASTGGEEHASRLQSCPKRCLGSLAEQHAKLTGKSPVTMKKSTENMEIS